MSDKTFFIVVGLAGSGKTSFCQRLYSWISQDKCVIDKSTGLNSLIYSINLDPAVVNSKMPLNMDIRDTIDYEEVMEKYQLGPNGAITTSLNLFLLNFNIENIPDTVKNIIIDTPGQIEAFTWSAPGQVLIEKTKQQGKVILIYLIDTPLSEDPSVFMSNMIFAVSLLCKFNIPLLCCFNKVDLGSTDRVLKWLVDYEEFRRALDDEDMNTPMLGSLCLHFEEFYNSLVTVGISAHTGVGKEEFFEKINKM